MTEKKVFVRKATGLVREIGFLTAMLIVICNMVGLGWQKRLFQFTGPRIVLESEYVLGLPPMVMAFILVGIVVLLTVWALSILGASMPRSGGGYVYISRILHPSVSYVASWLEYFSIAVSYGLIGTAVFEAITIYAWMAGWGTSWATPEALLLGGMVIVALFAIITCFGVRMTGMLLHVIFWVPAIITLVLYVFVLMATPEALNSGIESLTHPMTTANAFTTQALAGFSGVPGMGVSPASYWDAVSYASLGAFWAYIGFGASTFVAGEIKEAAKNLPKQLFTANTIVVFLYITISFLVARAAMMVGQVGGYSFFSSYSWLSYGAGGAGTSWLSSIGVGKAWMPNIAGFVAQGIGQGWFLALIPIFAALWVANDIPPFILTSSRVIFAMAFDRVLPEKLAEVNERWHTPIYAVIVTMIVAFIGNFAESDVLKGWLGSGHILYKFLNPDGGVAATDIWDSLFFLLCAVACMIFVFRRKDIYERSPFKAGGPMVVALIGTIATVANIWFLWQVINGWKWWASGQPWWTVDWDGLAWTAWVWTLIIIIVSLLVYYYYRTKGKRAGVDYSTIYAEIPPE